LAQLSAFIRACDRDLNITEELLDIIYLHHTTTGGDIFKEVCRLFGEYDPSLSKLVCMATDGAPSLTGKISGFVAKLIASFITFNALFTRKCFVKKP
jgi:hypothetical protein